MTTLSNLSDVGDLSAATDDSYLGFDEASGLWVPKEISFREFSFTAEYPEGDNGWVHFDDVSVACEHIENIASMPSNDDAKVYEFTVTSGMLVDVTGGEPWSAQSALKISMSFEVLFTATRSCRISLSVNGVQQSYQAVSTTSSQRRMACAATINVEVGDVVAVHAWRSTGEASETHNLVRVAAAPTIGSWPDGDLDGRSILIYAPDMTVKASSWVQVAPAGESAIISGTTASPLNVVRQNGASAYSATTAILHTWGLRGFDLGVANVRIQNDGATNTATGDPYLFRTLQVEEVAFFYFLVVEPA